MKKAFVVTITSLALFLGFARAEELDPDSQPPITDVVEVPEPPRVDTAIVLSNLGNLPARVSLKVWDATGEPVGSFELRVPANGLRYVFASRLAERAGLDALVGKVEARALGHVTGSAVLLGGPLTDLHAINRVRNLPPVVARRNDLAPDPADVVPRAVSRVSFPLVVTY
ncbi:MAG: hypothetical protein KatS3mg076_2272 [Candidatus Binatia bacterium]|nr:MAG: hypothetical protein KatS3mg076_2272 [Candidatus Binatia bacterium]